MCGGVQRRVMACSGGVQRAAAACGVWRAACKQVASDGYGKAKTDELLYYSLCFLVLVMHHRHILMGPQQSEENVSSC